MRDMKKKKQKDKTTAGNQHQKSKKEKEKIHLFSEYLQSVMINFDEEYLYPKLSIATDNTKNE